MSSAHWPFWGVNGTHINHHVSDYSLAASSNDPEQSSPFAEHLSKSGNFQMTLNSAELDHPLILLLFVCFRFVFLYSKHRIWHKKVQLETGLIKQVDVITISI